MFQMANIGPMYGQAWHFRSVAPERLPYAVERYTNEVTRLLRVMEQRLKESPYLGDAEFSIADIAAWPWVKGSEKYGQDMRAFSQRQRAGSRHDRRASRRAARPATRSNAV